MTVEGDRGDNGEMALLNIELAIPRDTLRRALALDVGSILPTVLQVDPTLPASLRDSRPGLLPLRVVSVFRKEENVWITFITHPAGETEPQRYVADRQILEDLIQQTEEPPHPAGDN